MSIQTALAFIQKLRTDESLKRQLADSTCDIERFVEIGQQLEMTFSAADVVAAHKYDWGMRWMTSKNQQRS